MRRIVITLTTLFLSLPSYAGSEDGVHNCIQIKSVEACVERAGISYKVVDRYSAENMYANCIHQPRKSNTSTRVYRCSTIYESNGVNEYLHGKELFMDFVHHKVSNYWYLTFAGLLE